MAGRFLGSLFGGPEPARSAEGGVQPMSSEEDDLVRAGEALNRLRSTVRRNGELYPPVIYSQVRQILDVLHSLVKYIHQSKASTEQLVLLAAIVGDYLPGALQVYILLSESSRQDTSAETTTLLSQLGTLHVTATNLDRQVRTGAVTELAVHGRFLQDKFELGSLHLEGN